MSELTSVQNDKVKRLVKLRRDRSYREKQQAVVLVGATLCSELTVKTPAINLFVRGAPSGLGTIRAHTITPVTDAVFTKIAGLATGETVIAEMPLPAPRSMEGAHRILVLDGISDPGNLGTLLRTALALGWEGVVLLENCADPFNEKALRASRGALFSLPYTGLKTQQLSGFIKENQLTPYVAHLKGESVTPPLATERLLLVMGSEAHGPSPEVLALCRSITIPISPQMESLNVAAAGAILLHAFQKR